MKFTLNLKKKKRQVHTYYIKVIKKNFFLEIKKIIQTSTKYIIFCVFLLCNYFKLKEFPNTNSKLLLYPKINSNSDLNSSIEGVPHKCTQK